MGERIPEANEQNVWTTRELRHPGFVSLMDAGHYFGVSASTLRDWIAAGTCPVEPVRHTPKSPWKFRVCDLEAYARGEYQKKSA